ncbi:hypothetical protein CesoFtcFv8_012157 [Champsocephalus esox]|uniref:Uncharacterized protein n=1 Tax=Champsocephalus esox TaxID=159716 RepID=A0AAN8BUM8_9TELE|nr:hypothetical protein CesoFtcFv8_012157 [Champsocephalus esox]
MINAPRILSVLAVVGLLGGSAVNTLPSPFSCCPGATLTYEPRCETTFILNVTNFARSAHGESECIAPCTEMRDGRMKLTGCPNVTARIVCKDENNSVEEKEIQYIGDLCAAVRSNSMERGHHCWVVFLLLAVLIAALWSTSRYKSAFVQQMETS